MEPREEFSQLRLRFIDPIQDSYEVIRPVVLFAQPVAARSRETAIERTTVGEKARLPAVACKQLLCRSSSTISQSVFLRKYDLIRSSPSFRVQTE